MLIEIQFSLTIVFLSHRFQYLSFWCLFGESLTALVLNNTTALSWLRYSSAFSSLVPLTLLQGRHLPVVATDDIHFKAPEWWNYKQKHESCHSRFAFPGGTLFCFSDWHEGQLHNSHRRKDTTCRRWLSPNRWGQNRWRESTWHLFLSCIANSAFLASSEVPGAIGFSPGQIPLFFGVGYCTQQWRLST